MGYSGLQQIQNDKIHKVAKIFNINSPATDSTGPVIGYRNWFQD